ncbi:MAG: phenylalanine--tRNA ligase subunit alpha [Planctomycetes bacterium]|nr:phenylalanine--tRNA ligase subunit alpha [Planctomycetota bacterium]
MLESLAQLESEGLASLVAAKDAAGLEAWRLSYLGPSGKLKAAMGDFAKLPKEQKAAGGARMNAVRAALEAAFAERKGALGANDPSPETVDLTEPGFVTSTGLGRRHIITRVREELCEVFARMGFEVADGPELEDDEHNFARLNIPAEHPARDPIDNFYVDDPRKVSTPRMLRSQTSTVQIRVMEAAVKAGGGQLRAPIKIVAPGRVYRPDTVDATHSFMFHQIEGLYIDRAVTMADLKTTLVQFAQAYFGEDSEIRLRPSFFPFTEPSAELDMKIRFRADQPAKWVELGGCGMVHPNVLQGCGINPEEWQGFAFGFGIERIAMKRYEIPDIRMLFENDIRFLSQL